MLPAGVGEPIVELVLDRFADLVNQRRETRELGIVRDGVRAIEGGIT